MPVSQLAEVVQHLRRMLLRKAGGSTDAQLLEQFVTGREETALESLVLRHGPMVWGVCRRILRNHHDAEDAFQATFLVLIRKAASIAPRDMLGNWLHGVAHRTALNGRALAARRSVHEMQVPVLPEPEVQPDSMSELRAVIDDEVSRLPANYRAVLVLCELEGRTRSEAAEQLGVPEGTIASRLARAKSMLAKRLTRGGVILSAAASATLLTGPAWSATLPPLLKVATVKAGLAFSAGQSLTSCGVSAAVVDLVQGVLTMMATKKMMVLALIVLVTATLGCGIIYLAAGYDAGRGAKRQAVGVPVSTPAEDKGQPNRRGGDAAPATLVTQVGHGSAYWDYVPSLALSEDGKFLVTGGYLGACLWETATGREIRSFRGSEIQAVALSKDAKLLATAGGQGVIHLWDVDTGKEIRVFDQMWVTVLAFSSDGKQLVAGGTKVVDRAAEGVVRSWNVQTGKELRVFQQKEKTMNTDLHALAISHDCKWLVAGVYSDLGEVQLWNLNTGAPVRTFPGPWDVQGVAVSSDDKQVVTTNSEGTTRLWNLASGKEIRSFGKPEKPVEFEERVTSMSMSADGKWLLTAKQDRSADVWELATGKRVRTVRGKWDRFQQLEPRGPAVIPVVINGDGKWFITGSPEKTVQMWEAPTGAPIRTFEGLANPADRMALSDDNKWLVTTGEENTCRLWDLTKGCSVRTFRGHKSANQCVALSRDNKWLVTGSSGSDSTARIWDMTTGNEIHVLDHPGQNYVNSVAFSNDGKWVATGTYFGKTILWDRLTGKQVRDFPKLENQSHVQSLVFSSDDKRLVTGAVDGAHLLDVSTGKEIRSFHKKDNVHWQVFLSADDKWLVTSAGDQKRRVTTLWDLETGKEIRSFAGYAWATALSRDGKWLVTGDDDTARLWDVATGKEVRAFSGHTSQISAVALTRDGKKLLTAGSGDCSLRLWDLATGQELCRLVSFKDGSWATYDPDGRYDSPKGGDVQGLHWTVGNETRPLSQFRGQFYNPGLLAKYLRFNREASREKGKSQDTSDNANYLEAEKRAEAFMTAVKTAKDPVALAIPLVKGTHSEAMAALYVLFEHGDDPRVEPILREVAKTGPHVAGGLVTLAGEAQMHLNNIASMREQAEVLEGAQTPEAKVAKIRAYIESHPDLLNSPTRPPEKTSLLFGLMATARQAEDAGAPPVFDLVLQSGCFNNKDAVRYAQRLIDHVKKLGADKTLASPDLLDWVIASEHKDGLPLIREWLKSATDQGAIEKLVKSLRYFPDARESFSALLSDPRPEVVRAAIWQLYFGFPDEKSLEAIRIASERRRQAGAPAAEMDQYSGIIRTLESNLSTTKKGNEKP